MKKTISVILSLVLVIGLLFTFVACDNNDKYDKELISDGSFVNGSSYWYSYNDSAAGTTIKGTEEIDGQSDNYYLTLSNKSSSGNYYQVYQKVSVKKGGVYKVSAKIRNDSLAIGADDTYVGGGIEVIGAEENGVIILSDSNVDSDWVIYTAYIKVKGSDTLTLAMTIGGEDARVVGKVSFDDVSVMRVKASDVPDNAEVINIKILDKDYEYSSTTGNLIVILLSILSAILIIAAYYLYKYFAKDVEDKPLFKKTWINVAIIAFVAMLIRFVIAGTLFKGAGTIAFRDTLVNLVNVGLKNATTNGYASYAPFELYYMWVIGKITYNISGNVSAVNVVANILPILCEAATAMMVYAFAKKYTNDKQATLFGTLYAVLPIFFITSAGYSIELPIFIFLLFISFWALMDKDFVMLLVCSLINCLWTPLGIYVLPFIVVYEVYIMVKTKEKKTIITLSVGWFLSFWAFILLSAVYMYPKFMEGNIVYVFKNYVDIMFNKQLCVSNAFNLYALFGLNGGDANNAAFWLNIAFSVILIVYSVSLYFKNFNRAEMTLIAGFFMTVMAVFSLNMNENALALGLILLLMYVIVTGEERLFWVFGVLSVLAFINTSIVMDYTGFVSETYKAIFFNKGDAGYAIANVLACIVVLYYGWVVYDITTNDKRVFLQPLVNRETK